jgi:hypothetical protein
MPRFQKKPPPLTKTGERLAAARDELASVQARITDLGRQRSEALLDDRDAEAKQLALQLDELAQTARGLEDKVRLLMEKQQQEEQELAAEELAKKIEHVEDIILERDRAGKEMARCIKMLDNSFRRMFKANRAIRAAWKWGNGEENALLLGDNDLANLIRFESYRIGARPALGGGKLPAADHDGPSLPGGKSPRLEWLGTPERIMPLVDHLKQVSEWASRTLRGQGALPPPVEARLQPAATETPSPMESTSPDQAAAEVTSAPAAQDNGDINYNNVKPPPATTLSRSGRTLGQLYQEQSRLAALDPNDESVERQYQLVLDEIRELMEAA